MRPSLLVVPFYCLTFLALTWPLARVFATHLPAVYGPADALLQVFLLGWGWMGLTTEPLRVFDAPIFYPEPRTLTYMDHMLGEAVTTGPVAQAFGLGVAYNSLVLFSFVGSGWFLYRLARLLGVSRAGSCLAGFLFAFCPYRFSNLGELNQLQTQFVPLGLFFAVRFLRSGRVRDGAGAALTFAVQSTFGWYTTFHLATALGLLVAWESFRERGGWRRVRWRPLAGWVAVAGVLIAPGILPYWIQHRTLPEFHRSIGDSALWSADLLDYFRLPPENLLARAWPFVAGHQGYSPGLVAVALALIGGLALRRRGSEGRYVALLGISGFLLSLGPVLQVAGRKLWIPLPYALCYYVLPGFSAMRVPGRFALLVALAAAILAGVGLDRLRRGHPRYGSVIFGLALGAAIFLARSEGIPFVSVPDRASMPPVYAWLAEQPGRDPILEIPLPAVPREENATHARRQFYVLYHGKPRLDGVSGFTSRRVDAFRLQMQAFPDPPTLSSAAALGAKTLIVHYGDFDPVDRDELRRRVSRVPELREAAAFGDDVVYHLGNDRSSPLPP